jgi:hypothetical protein
MTLATPREIMSAQACALAVQSERFDLLQSKRGLEEETVRLKAWSTEKYRYELQNVGPRAVAYVVKANMQGTAPAHWICANSFQTGKKRFHSTMTMRCAGALLLPPNIARLAVHHCVTRMRGVNARGGRNRTGTAINACAAAGVGRAAPIAAIADCSPDF